MVVYAHDLRVAARNEQAEEGKLRLPVLRAGHLHEVRKDMPLQVVDLDDGFTGSHRKPFGEGGSHQQRAQQARAAGESQRIHLLHPDTRLIQRLRYHRHDILLVRTRREFRHDAAVTAMHLLRGHLVGEQVFVADDGSGGVVTGGFNSENGQAHT